MTILDRYIVRSILSFVFMVMAVVLVLGGLFVFVTLFMPKGILGLWDQWQNRTMRKKPADDPIEPSTAPLPQPMRWARQT